MAVDEGHSDESWLGYGCANRMPFAPGGGFGQIAGQADGIDMSHGEQGGGPAGLIIEGARGELQGFADAQVEQHAAAFEQGGQASGQAIAQGMIIGHCAELAEESSQYFRRVYSFRERLHFHLHLWFRVYQHSTFPSNYSR